MREVNENRTNLKMEVGEQSEDFLCGKVIFLYAYAHDERAAGLYVKYKGLSGLTMYILGRMLIVQKKRTFLK